MRAAILTVVLFTVTALAQPSGKRLQSAVQDQLGLHLEAKRSPIEIHLVDGGDKTPTEN